MLKILYYPIDTNLDFQECINAMYSFNTSGIPILFKVKGTNRYVAIVQSIVGDIIESSGSSYSYHKFINILHNKKIEGNVILIAEKSNDAELYHDKKLNLNLTPAVVKLNSSSKNKFIQDQSGTVILCSYINQYVKDEDGNIFNEI